MKYINHSEYELFESFPGAGPVFGPLLLAAFGTNRERFKSVDKVNRLSGIAPVLNRSGKYTWTHWRYSCQNSSVKYLLNGRTKVFAIHFGHVNFMMKNEQKESLIKQALEPWHLSGYELCIVAGKIKCLMMNLRIYSH
jgi:hypothetical protein